MTYNIFPCISAPTGIYEVFSGNKNFHIGKQPDVLEDTDTVCFHFYVELILFGWPALIQWKLFITSLDVSLRTK